MQLLLLLLLVFTCNQTKPTTAVIEDVVDILHVVKEVTSGVLKAWDIVQSSPLAANIEFPLMREKQRKVLQRLKEVSRQIDQSEAQVCRNIPILSIENTNFLFLFSILNTWRWPLTQSTVLLAAMYR